MNYFTLQKLVIKDLLYNPYLQLKYKKIMAPSLERRRYFTLLKLVIRELKV